jgi:hypothetical protein
MQITSILDIMNYNKHHWERGKGGGHKERERVWKDDEKQASP